MMRRVFLLTGAVVFAYAVRHVTMTRSTTIRLAPAGYELTYSMAWGLGMKERLTLKKVGALWSSQSSAWTERRRKRQLVGWSGGGWALD